MQKGVVRSNIDLKAAWLTLMLRAAGRDSALQWQHGAHTSTSIDRMTGARKGLLLRRILHGQHNVRRYIPDACL
jgi:hypothetical protein